MEIRWIVGAVVPLLSAFVIVGWKMWGGKRKRKGARANWFSETFRNAHYYEVLKTFCSEAAVLWLVFPVVDVWEDPTKKWNVVYFSPLFVLTFLALSGLAARKEQEEKKREEAV